MSVSPQPEERGAGSSPSLRAALTEVADRIEEVLAAAEDAAARIVEEGEARVPGGRHEPDEPQRLAEALELAGEVVQRAELTARDAQGLSDAASRLQATTARLMDLDGGRTPSAHGRGSAHQASLSGGSGAAQLLAVQMAVAGSTDEEIRLRLRRQFTAEEVDFALDAVRKLEAGIR